MPMSGDTNTPSEISQLAVIRDLAKEAIITGTLDGIVTSWNNAAERMFGYRAAEITGKSFLTAVPEESREQELEIFERVRRGERTDEYETRRIHKGGRILEISVSYGPL